MNTQWLRWVNPVLFTVILIQIVSGLMLRFVGPSHLVFEIHENMGLVLVVVLLVHLTLNFGWIKAQYFKRK